MRLTNGWIFNRCLIGPRSSPVSFQNVFDRLAAGYLE
jgi:hypothetical protein